MQFHTFCRHGRNHRYFKPIKESVEILAIKYGKMIVHTTSSRSCNAKESMCYTAETGGGAGPLHNNTGEQNTNRSSIRSKTGNTLSSSSRELGYDTKLGIATVLFCESIIAHGRSPADFPRSSNHTSTWYQKKKNGLVLRGSPSPLIKLVHLCRVQTYQE